MLNCSRLIVKTDKATFRLRLNMMQKDQDSLHFSQYLSESLSDNTFVKLTLSKPSLKNDDLRNLSARIIEVKKGRLLSVTFRYQTRDEVKNFTFDEAASFFDKYLGQTFLNADLFTLKGHYTLRFNKKRKAKLIKQAASHKTLPPVRHNRQKRRLIDPVDHTYLHKLGVTNQEGVVLKSGQKKFRQINKYIEIIDALFQQQDVSECPHIVDMGSGKGYLTFALYDYLLKQRKYKATVTGIELRPPLVDFCNELARSEGFERLKFMSGDINDYYPERLDVLIALHACDTATDIAIAKGIKADAQMIIVAPCCHKQVRKQMSCPTDMQAILRHGVLEERQAELITDGVRALLLEAHGYKTKVFEFISTEHTPKNLMIVGLKGAVNPEAPAKIEAVKAQFGIDYHYLERLLE